MCSGIEGDRDQCFEWHSKCIIKVNSQVAALKLWEQSITNLSRSTVCWRTIEGNGIIIGPKKPKKILIPRNNRRWFRNYWIDSNVLDVQKYPDAYDCGNMHMHGFRSLLWKGTLYRIGDKVIVRSMNEDINLYWKAVITNFYTQEFEDRVGVFFEAQYYAQCGDREVLIHPHFNMAVVQTPPRAHLGDNIRHVSLIVHKFILLPAVGDDVWKGRSYAIAYELEDHTPRL